MRKTISIVSVALGMTAFAACPTISKVELENVGGKIRVSYKLEGAPAIVTVGFTMNGEQVAAEWAREGLSGDVGKAVQPGDHVLTWRAGAVRPDETFTGANLKAQLTAWALSAPPDYLAVPLKDGERGADKNRYYASAETVPGGVTNDLYKTDVLLLRRMRASGVTWRMGAPEKGKNYNSKRDQLAHLVTLTNDYYIGIYEFTTRQYHHIAPKEDTGGNAAAPDYDKRPCITRLSDLRSRDNEYRWPEKGHAVKKGTFFDTMRKQVGLEFDLPTEAQWEFACRAGTTTTLYNGADEATADALRDIAWFPGNWADDPNGATNEVHAVGLKQPNAWGFYDMIGNAGEICLDVMPADSCVLNDIYAGQDAIEPVGPCQADADAVGYALDYEGTNGRHARRGGWCVSDGADPAKYPAPSITYCRCDSRLTLSPTAGYWSTGFRAVCPATCPMK